MTPQTKARIDFLVDHEYRVYRYDVRNVDLAKLFDTQEWHYPITVVTKLINHLIQTYLRIPL